MKQNFEALGTVVGGTLINVFKPIVSALNVVIGKFIQFAKVVSESLGKIFGWEYQESGVSGVTNEMEDAADASTGVADGLNNANKNAKKLRQQLQGFDELNVLSSDKDSSTPNNSNTGTSGTSGTGDASSGKWEKTESIFKEYESSLDNLYKLGEYIGTTLTNALNDINWNKVYEGARNFGTGLASFLNGLISPELFSALGQTVANSINTAVEGAHAFVTVFQWRELGKSIGAGVNSILDNVDFTKLMQTGSDIFASFFDTISAAIQEIKWGQLGSQVVKLIKDIDFANIANSFFEMLGSALGGLLNFVGGVVSEAFSGLADFISSCLDESGQMTIQGFLKGIVNALKNIGEWIKNNIFKPFIDGFLNVFEIHSPAETMVEPGENVIAGVFEGIKSGFKSILDWFSGLPEKIKTTFETAWDEIKTWWSNNVKLPNVDVAISSIKDKIESAWNSAKTWWNDKREKLSSVSATITSIKDNLKEKWENARKWWKNKKEKLTNVSANISSIKDNLEGKWKSAKSYWKKKGSLSSISVVVSSIKDKLKSAWDSARKWWKNNKPKLSEIMAKIKIPRLKVTWDTEGWAAKALQKLGLKGFPNFSVKYYAMGGFPEDGWFRANHGELMGKFDNGRTVVANNKQITQGIADAVYQGNRENNALLRQELELMRRQNNLLSDILEKETGISAGELFSSVRQSANDYKRRTGRPAFSY